MLHPGLILLIVVGIVLFFVVLVNSLGMFGFYTRYLFVRIMQGGLVLIKIRGKTDDYYRIGRIKMPVLSLKKRYAKYKSELTIPKERPIFYRSLGITMCDLDEESNEFITMQFSAVAGFDEQIYEQIVIRALMAPIKQPNWMYFFIGLGLILLIAGATAYMVNELGEVLLVRHGEILAALNGVREACQVVI